VRPAGLVPKQAKIVIGPRVPAIHCDVIEISAGGAQVVAHGTAEMPQRVTFLHSGIKKSARVVWKKGRRMGLQF